MSVISAYEKMLKDGSANVPIRINQPSPENPDGGMGGSGVVNPALGESKDNDWSDFDSKMEKYIKEKKLKKPKKSGNESSKIKKLETRIALLENVVEQIMKAQMDLLKNG